MGSIHNIWHRLSSWEHIRLSHSRPMIEINLADAILVYSYEFVIIYLSNENILSSVQTQGKKGHSNILINTNSGCAKRYRTTSSQLRGIIFLVNLVPVSNRVLPHVGPYIVYGRVILGANRLPLMITEVYEYFNRG